MVRDRKTKNRTVLIASDHAGFNLKEKIRIYLIRRGIKVLDLGTKNSSSVDYPDYAHQLCKKMNNSQNRFGVLVCGSGIGMAMAANKHKKIRAALCYNIKSAKLSRMHNDANVITLGSRLTKKNIAVKCVNTFLITKFDGGRHIKRVKKI